MAALVLGSGAALAQSAQYQLLAPNHPEMFHAYRLNTTTGEVTACWFALTGDVGGTECATAGTNAGPQAGGGTFVLVQNANPTEAGVFRLNTTTGGVSLCYLDGWVVLCTPESLPGAGGPPPDQPPVKPRG